MAAKSDVWDRAHGLLRYLRVLDEMTPDPRPDSTAADDQAWATTRDGWQELTGRPLEPETLWALLVLLDGYTAAWAITYGDHAPAHCLTRFFALAYRQCPPPKDWIPDD